jgi:hypothetical protein
MSNGNQPEYTADDHSHAWEWPDRTSLEIRGPRWDAFRRLKAEVIARADDGQLLLNQGVIDLLNESDRARFHQNAVAAAASLNGRREELARLDWYRRLLDALETVQGRAPSAAGQDSAWDPPAPFYESDLPPFPTDALPR